jgi:hypothetical protein
MSKRCHKYTHLQDNIISTGRNMSDEEINQLAEKLQIYEGTVGFTWPLMKEPQKERPLLVDVEEIFFCEEYLNSQNQANHFIQSTQIVWDPCPKTQTITDIFLS